MTDRELLTLAAKAADIDAEFHSELGYGPEGMWLKGARSPDNSKYWNPLRDDGDALRLAVKLNLLILPYPDDNAVRVVNFESQENSIVSWGNPPDPCASTRRAIVRAAAEIGKAMP